VCGVEIGESNVLYLASSLHLNQVIHRIKIVQILIREPSAKLNPGLRVNITERWEKEGPKSDLEYEEM
jgi:hypothetical protein